MIKKGIEDIEIMIANIYLTLTETSGHLYLNLNHILNTEDSKTQLYLCLPEYLHVQFR